MDEFTLKLSSPITDEQWDAITDVDFDNTNRVSFSTKHGKEVEFIKVVRCKDCRAYGEMLPDKDNRMICHKWALNFEPNHYCSYGARKDGGVNDAAD